MHPKSDAAPLVIATAAGVTYAVLSASNFSPDSFPQSPSFFPRIRNAAPFAAQVTHLADGGAAVALRISHQLCDGRACFAVAAAWGQLHRGLKLAPPPQHDRAVLQAIAAVTRPPDVCECYGILPPFQAVLSSDTSPLNSSAALRSTAPPLCSTAAHVDTLSEGEKQHSSAAWVSTLDALNGHLWCAVMRARRAAGSIPADALQPHAVSRLWFTVDGRRRFKLKSGASLPAGFSGNVYMFSCAEQPLATLAPAPPSAAVAAGAAAEMSAAHCAGTIPAATATAAAAANDAPEGHGAAPPSAASTCNTAAAASAAAAAAAAIRNAVDRADPAACLTWVSAQPDQSRVFLRGLVPTPTSFLSTDWRFADAYAIDFGEGQPAKLRRAPMPGRIMACVLPAPPGEGGVEVYMGLRKAVWTALDADAQFRRPPH
ncbi:transferase family-domain-containing protein [Tribonema minus]|uniref:Transferase family-domain-containing protein n=1 Tax=Tribonema minus TaxID=303371 RepID=A0A835ZNZ5_9STRA|nr:transferase family-domain-containing protein [Tribonema minus]